MPEPMKDTDAMPFGKYSRTNPPTLMQDVPASYLHWLWSNGKDHDTVCPVANYIRRNIVALKAEYQDGIW